MKINSEDINALLEEMHEVDVSQLGERAKNLFYAIMQIADERDKLKSNLYKEMCDKDNLIKYLEDKIKVSSSDDTYINGLHFLGQNHAVYKDILERVKGGKYE